MKKNLIIIVFFSAFLSITSCDKKNYICTCTTRDSTGTLTATDYTSIYGKKADAKKKCTDLSVSKSGKTTICTM